MSDVRKVTEGAVTSIADADLVMCSIGGTYHPISFANLMAAVRGGIQIGGRNLLKGTYSAAVLNGQGTASKYYPYAQVISWPEWVGKYMTISFDYDCENVATGASAMSSRIVLSVSIEVSSKTLYYEAVVGIPLSSTNYSASGRKVFTFKVPEGASGTKTTQALNIQVLSGNVRVWNVKIEEGNMATAWTPAPEDIASGAWGGVIGLHTINYAINKKGGLRDGRNEEADKRPLEGEDDGCDGDKNRCSGRKSHPYERNIREYWKHEEYALRCLRLWNIVSDGKQKFHRTTILSPCKKERFRILSKDVLRRNLEQLGRYTISSLDVVNGKEVVAA